VLKNQRVLDLGNDGILLLFPFCFFLAFSEVSGSSAVFSPWLLLPFESRGNRYVSIPSVLIFINGNLFLELRINSDRTRLSRLLGSGGRHIRIE
jgi:hypothetical protein